jgi:hypothetical protein
MRADPVYACVYTSLMQHQSSTCIILLQQIRAKDEDAAPQPAAETPQPAAETPQPAAETPQPAAETPQPAVVLARRFRLGALLREVTSCVLLQIGCFAWVCTDQNPLPFWVAGCLVLLERRARLLRLLERAVVVLRWAPLSGMYCFVASAVPGWTLPAELTWVLASASAE